MIKNYCLAFRCKADFLVFDYYNGYRRAVGTVNKRHFDYGVFVAVEGREIFEKGVLFLEACFPAVVDDEGHYSAVFKKLQPLFNGGDTGFLTGENVVVASWKPAKIESYTGHGFLVEKLVHFAVTFQQHFCTVCIAFFGNKLFCAVYGILLDIKGGDASAFAYEGAEKLGVVSPACGCVYTYIALFYVFFKHSPDNIEGTE